MDPANALATLLNRELGTDIKPDDMRSFIVLNWPSVTTFAHAIHDQGATAGPATAPVVPDQEALDRARKERVTALHGIKTLAMVRDQYAELAILQRLHRAVDQGDANLVLRTRWRDAEMPCSDEAAMALAFLALRDSILRVRASLIELGFDPNASDPHDDEGQDEAGPRKSPPGPYPRGSKAEMDWLSSRPLSAETTVARDED